VDKGVGGCLFADDAEFKEQIVLHLLSLSDCCTKSSSGLRQAE